MITAVVLAAGLGTRMGATKPLLDVGGRAALECVVTTLREAGIPDVVVVLGRDADRVRAGVDLGAAGVVRNEHPEDGLASSLRLGLDAVRDECAGVLILHADMPFVRESTVRAVCAAAEAGAEIAAPEHAGRRGFPVYFSREHVSSLRASLAGDEGGRRYVEAHPNVLRLVSVEDAGCIRDLDRPEDLGLCEGSLSWTTSA